MNLEKLEYLYINGSSSVSIVKNDHGEITEVYIDKKLYNFEDDEANKLELAQKIKRQKYSEYLQQQFYNLTVLTGAGSSVNIGVGERRGRLMTQLWDDTREAIGEDVLNRFCTLVKYNDTNEDGTYVKNLEKLLSIASAAKKFIRPEPDLNVEETIQLIQNLIKNKCDLELPDNAPHSSFIEKITKRKPTNPRVKLFTLNYDTLFEQAGRKGNYTIIDGFSFSAPRLFSGRNFDYDIVFREKSRLKEEDNFINRVFHLYKLHGSVDWEKRDIGIVQSSTVENAIMIYPKDNKYESSYEQPFFEMMSRFQQTLRKDNVLLICIGFSFNDKHIVTAIKESLEQNSGFQLLVVNKGICKGNDFSRQIIDLAHNHNNIVLIDELFTDFSAHYPVLTSYDQKEHNKIVFQSNLEHDK